MKVLIVPHAGNEPLLALSWLDLGLAFALVLAGQPPGGTSGRSPSPYPLPFAAVIAAWDGAPAY